MQILTILGLFDIVLASDVVSPLRWHCSLHRALGLPGKRKVLVPSYALDEGGNLYFHKDAKSYETGALYNFLETFGLSDLIQRKALVPSCPRSLGKMQVERYTYRGGSS